MRDKALTLEVLRQVHSAALTILERVEPVSSVEGFTDSSAGKETLDSVCMLLIAIGEGLKNLDKITDESLLPNYPEIDWKKAKAMRDVISHHYFEVDAEVIYHVCKNHIGPMARTIAKIMEDLSPSI